MVDNPAATPRKAKQKGGRPTRAEASAKALRGVDLASIDPVAILKEIAGDTSAPAGARVAAAKALLEVQDQDAAENSGGDTRINARAAAMMRRAN